MSSYLEGKLIRMLGYQGREKKEIGDEYKERIACEGCDGGPTAYVRLTAYKELRKMGFSDEWTLDPVFFAYLCKSCFLLYRGYDTAWARHYAKRLGVKYVDAKMIRESEYLRLIERLEKKIDLMQQTQASYAEKITPVVIRPLEDFPQIEGVVSYVDASSLRVEKAVTVFVIEKKM